MYKYTSKQIRIPGGFFLPFGGKLNPENRWVILSSMIPWEEFEEGGMPQISKRQKEVKKLTTCV